MDAAAALQGPAKSQEHGLLGADAGQGVQAQVVRHRQPGRGEKEGQGGREGGSHVRDAPDARQSRERALPPSPAQP